MDSNELHGARAQPFSITCRTKQFYTSGSPGIYTSANCKKKKKNWPYQATNTLDKMALQDTVTREYTINLHKRVCII